MLPAKLPVVITSKVIFDTSKLPDDLALRIDIVEGVHAAPRNEVVLLTHQQMPTLE